MAALGTESFRSGTPVQTPEGNVVMNFSFDGYPLEEEEPQTKERQRQGSTGTSKVNEPGYTCFVCESDYVESQPKDSYHGIYFAMLLAGVGFLLPYNSFITDVDYLHQKYPGTSIVFDMSLTYILVALAAVILNNALVELLSLHTRITVGNTMTVSYMSGLTLGSAVAYVTYSLTSMSHTSCIHTETINASLTTGF
ncbi:equilibrative nucleoside transporter 4-like [Rhincodon typus]|uniref:equilibrative nucleoside transporter 4-like n=1 Tax=Rhincodon typus TaxID=259920 RepID=UPI00202EC242|nr:equilibrative nucleoside transporter 4-like [Rhincodon typus]